MAIIKCKMCGGDLEILEDSSVCECEYCGTKQTVPKVDDEKKLKLFERANRLRTACEFDKAAGVYETIVADFDQEAEAYWGLILCKYGIEYVDDPGTGKKIPTCHRSSFESLMDDPNFEMVMECADPVARRVYREEAKAIEELRKGIIEVSSKEEPYDVFISYKELDENGERTLDSVIAQDIYTELTDKGHRVFFSRISLEDKLGVEYEPYIFAALNSAKVMIVVGTDYDYFNAVWVKNEWSRYLALMGKGEKKTLIPVFKGIDAYDMPKEFAKLAAQDMGKVGAMQDLVRGVEKLLGKKQEEAAPVQPAYVPSGGPNIVALLDRGGMALEDGNWEKAKDLYDQVLNMDARNADAYLGQAMANKKCSTTDQLIDRICFDVPMEKTVLIRREEDQVKETVNRCCVPGVLERATIMRMLDQQEEYVVISESQAELVEMSRKNFEENKDLTRAFRYATGESKARMDQLRSAFEARLNALVTVAREADETAEREARERFESARDEAERKLEETYQDALVIREEEYQKACETLRTKPSYAELVKAEAVFSRLEDYKNCRELKKETEAAKEEALYYERVTKEVARYQEKINWLEKELPNTPILKRPELKKSIKWYRSEIEKLQGK